jgi:hypothetical protein
LPVTRAEACCAFRRVRTAALAVLAVAMFLVAEASTAQVSGAEPNKAAEPSAALPEGQPTYEQLQTQILLLKESINRLEQPAHLQFLQYQAAVMEMNISQLKAQWVAGYVVLALVALVVLAGTTFAAFQLWKSVTIGGVQGSHDLELSASRVRVTSSVVGVVVLAISLGFLYIYAREIYQLHPLELSAPESSPK